MNSTYSPIPELNLLFEFQDRAGFENYSDGFGLTDFGDTSGLKAAWSKDPEFLQRLIPFAQANGTGSEYAFWRLDDRSDLATLPVVVFGDEGGKHVIARNLGELLQVLAYDGEVSVDWDSAYYYRDEEDEHSPGHEEYVAWLRRHLDLSPVDDSDAIVEVAQAELADRFSAWAGIYLQD